MLQNSASLVVDTQGRPNAYSSGPYILLIFCMIIHLYNNAQGQHFGDGALLRDCVA